MVELVRPKKLADQAYEALLEMIASGVFPVARRLPSEDSLAKSLKVSRPVVREALTRLRGDGIVTSRQGSGSYVEHAPNKALFDVAPQGTIAGLMRTFEFRIALECAAAELAAMRRTDRDTAAMERAFGDLELVIAKAETGAREDVMFHRAIILAARNELFLDAMMTMEVQVTEGIETARRLSINKSARRLQLVQEEHRRIIDAITAGDPNESRLAMHAHLRNARDRVLTDRVGETSGSTAP